MPFLALNTRGGAESLAKATTFIEKSGYTFPVGYDKEGTIRKSFGSTSIPLTVVVDREARIRFYATGFAGPDALNRGLDLQINHLLER